MGFCTFKDYLFQHFREAKALYIKRAFYCEVFLENYFFCSEKMKINAIFKKNDYFNPI